LETRAESGLDKAKSLVAEPPNFLKSQFLLKSKVRFN